MQTTNIILIGAGMASASLGVLLRELNPKINILMLERLDEIAKESSFAFNNAGTGHAGYCELNYTPELANGSIDMKKALKINAGYQSTLHLLASLVEQGKLKNPENFITPTPHASLVWGERNISYLEKRYKEMQKNACFDGVEFTRDRDQIAQWFPLCVEGNNNIMGATRVKHGADVNFSRIAKEFIDYLACKPSFELKLQNEVRDIKRASNNKWQVKYVDLQTHKASTAIADFVFIGAGGGSLTLLQKTGLSVAKNYGGFPVAGQWLVCQDEAIVKRHNAKVYGRAAVDALPMSMPHLDRRRIDGKDYIIFGPYAEFTTKFLKNGSSLDLFKSVRTSNLLPMASVGAKNLRLISYLMREATKTFSVKFNTLEEFYPNAQKEAWRLYRAGERVQIVRRVKNFGGDLVLGTEVVSAEDGSLAAFLGASPGASIMIHAMIEVIEKCLSSYLPEHWRDQLSQLVPTYFDPNLDVQHPENLDGDKFLHLQKRALASLKLI